MLSNAIGFISGDYKELNPGKQMFIPLDTKGFNGVKIQ
jgi:hypothetical protein